MIVVSAMKKLAKISWVLALFVFSPASVADVFRCVDEATGKVAFTDKDCPDKTAGVYIPVKPANADSGVRMRQENNNTWQRREVERKKMWKPIDADHNKASNNVAPQKTQDAINAQRRAESEESFNQAMYKKQCTRERLNCHLIK